LRSAAIIVRAGSGTGNRPQLVENAKFEPKLDAVESAFEGDLDIIKVGVLGTKESDIHQNDKNINID
jgi:hypothetical protein